MFVEGELNPSETTRNTRLSGETEQIFTAQRLQAVRSSRVHIGLMSVQSVLTPFGLSVCRPLGGRSGNDCSHCRARDLPLCTSQTRLAVMQWCMVSDGQQGCLTPPPSPLPAPLAVLSAQLPPPSPKSNGSASARDAFTTSQ